MGRSYTPRYIIRVNGQRLDIMGEWKTKERGKPTVENLEKWW